MSDGMRCAGCHGSGKVMSGGMVYASHETCKGTGRLTDPEDIIKQKIMQTYKTLSEDDAKKVMSEAQQEVSKKPVIIIKRKRGRPKMSENL